MLSLPAVKDGERVVFTAAAAVLYLLHKAEQKVDPATVKALLDLDSVSRALSAAQADASTGECGLCVCVCIVCVRERR